MHVLNQKETNPRNTVKPLITNTSEEFTKRRLDNEFYTILRKFQYLRK